MGSAFSQLYVKTKYSLNKSWQEKKNDTIKISTTIFCKVFTLKFALYREYYNDLQEKGLKMKAKKEDYSLDDTHAR